MNQFLKRIVVSALIILAIGSFSAQKAPAFDWAKRIGSTYHEEGLDITLDASGNVLTTGYFEGTVDFDPGSSTTTLSSSNLSDDIFISKLNTTGNFIWARRIGGKLSDKGLSIEADANDYLYITGFFRDTVDFDPGTGVFNLISAGKEDVFVLKLDPSGNFVWAARIGGNSNDISRAIAVDTSGNVYTTGEYDGVADFDPGTSTYTLAGPGVFVCKLSANGNLVWANGTDASTANAIDVDKSGNVYTTGQFYGYYGLDFDPGVGTYTLASFGYNDVYIRKLDASGNFLWAGSWGGISYDNGTSIVVDKTGNVYSTGYFRVTADFDPGVGTYTLNSGSSTCDDVFISKLDASGNFLWAKQMGGSLVDQGFGIALDTAGYVYSIGNFLGVADFDPAYSQFILSELSWSTPDIYFSKLDPSGNFVWARSMGGWSYDNGAAITVNAAGEIFSTGFFQGSMDCDPYLGVYTLTASGGYDAFIHKFTPCNIPAMAINVTSASLQTVCAGSSTTLSATGSGTITWGGAAYPATTGTNYVVTANSKGPGVHSFYATDNTCVNSQSPTIISVTVYPNPVISVSSGSICNGQSFTLVPSGAQSYNFQGGNAMVSPTITTVYTVTGTSSLGCVAAAPSAATVVVNPLPFITLSSGTICTGDSFTLSPAGAFSYTYQGGSAVVSPSANAAYTVAGTSAAGCLSPTVATANVVVNSRPIITVNSGSICSGKSFTIVPAGASTYTFQGGSAIVSPSFSKSYTVSGTNNLGCVSAFPAFCTVNVAPSPTIVSGTGAICAGSSYTIVPGGASTYTFSGGGPVVSPTIFTTYFVTGTSAAGCLAAVNATVSVGVYPLPTVAVSSGTICPGQSYTIVPSGAISYSIQGGSAIVSPLTSSTYTVNGINAFGCRMKTPVTASVTVFPGATISVNSGSICAGKMFTMQPTGGVTYVFAGGSAVVGPTSTTQFTVSGTGAGGCAAMNTATSMVTVMQLPTVTVNSGSVCEGESFTITPGGAVNYTIEGGSAIVSPNSSTQYTISGSGQNGCASNPAVATVTVYPRPVLLTSASYYSICINQESQLGVSGAVHYTWNPSLPAGGVVSPAITTTYSVTGSDLKNCTSVPNLVTISVQECTGLAADLHSSSDTFRVYPNPASKVIIIESSVPGYFSIRNSLGQIIREGYQNSSYAEVSLYEFADGIYFVTMGTTTKRIVKSN